MSIGLYINTRMAYKYRYSSVIIDQYDIIYNHHYNGKRVKGSGDLLSVLC